MAETPLTDSIEALTTYANQVTGASDTNLSDAVYTLAQGYGEGGGSGMEQYLTVLYQTFWLASVPMPLELDVPKCTTVNTAFQQISASNGEDIKITLHFNPDNPVLKNLRSAFYACYGLKEIKITGDLSGVTSYTAFLAYVATVEKIDCEFDFTSVTADNDSNIFSYNMTSLTYLRVKANTLSVNFNLNLAPALDDDSLVSVANGLNSSATGKTITINATPKARLSTIMGVVSDGLFVKDATGTLSLSDFITTVKGWTLA